MKSKIIYTTDKEMLSVSGTNNPTKEEGSFVTIEMSVKPVCDELIETKIELTNDQAKELIKSLQTLVY